MNFATFASSLFRRSASVTRWSCGVQGFSLIILEVEHRLRNRVRGSLTSASGHVKILWLRPLSTSSHLRTLTALDCSLLLETFAQDTFKDKLPITHTPGLLVIFTCLSETDFSSVATRGTLKKLYSHKKVKNTSGLDSCTFTKDRVDND